MELLKLNETPVRTSRNFNINNIKLENISIPQEINNFNNMQVYGDESKVIIDNQNTKLNLTYGLGEFLTNQVSNNANKKIKIVIDKKVNKEIEIDFKFDKENNDLIDNIEIVAEEQAKGTVILKYVTDKNIQAFHNGVIRLLAKKNSKVNIIVANLMNELSNNFMSIENKFEDESKVNYTIVDFGGKNSITNYFSDLEGELSDNKLSTIYLNYIGELRGKKSNIDIEVQGALKDNAKKHFKGTIDFKKGCKKATGNENEACMLLSDTAKSLALPMLLCSEEDVEGNHSSSAGKVGEKELFYIMSRGFELKEAMKLMVRAKFNKILDNIKNEDLKNEILDSIDKILD